MITTRKENNLQHFRYNREIIEAVISQLEKDVLLCGGTLNISNTSVSDLELLKSEVQQYVSTLSVTNPALLFNLLYRIDIPQNMLADAELGSLILKRELAKVLLRMAYSKQ